MESITWKHIALVGLVLLFVGLVAALYTFGGETGQEAASTIATFGAFAALMVWLWSS